MRKIQLLLAAIITFANASAQKLPNVQQTSLRAPAGLKIDGKATEWGQFAAYNNATNLHYTVANDDKNLYLAIQCDDANTLTKITTNGIKLLINPTGKKDDKGAIALNYPAFEIKGRPNIQFANAGGLMAVQRKAMQANPDSMLAVANKKLTTYDKYIRTNGMAGVDTLLSVYNENDIVARQGFEKWPVYAWEMAIPLKYLNLSVGAKQKFAYHIVLKGIKIGEGIRTEMIGGRLTIVTPPNMPLYRKDDFVALESVTDFWGEYTLAK